MNGRWIGKFVMAMSSVGGDSEIVSWMNGRATWRESREGRVEVHEQRGLRLGHRRDLAGGRVQRVMN